MNPDIHGGDPASPRRTRLDGRGTSTRMAVWLLDAAGAQVRQLEDIAEVEIRFRDADGQWWRRTDPQQNPSLPAGELRGRARWAFVVWGDGTRPVSQHPAEHGGPR